MPYCPKCGNQVDENMTFCPRCGAPLKMGAQAQAAPAPPPMRPRNEKGEKSEKGEKKEKQEPEKGEKQEKGEYGYVGWLVGGLILIIIGSVAFVRIFYPDVFSTGFDTALVLLLIGIIIIVAAVYLTTMARKRNPTPVR